MKKLKTIEQLEKDWKENPRWHGVKRSYSAENVVKLRGSHTQEYSLAEMNAKKLWQYFKDHTYINALGALSGNQAMQMAKAGLKSIYLSGWQVAADANTAGTMYPDQSLYPANSVPQLVRAINRCLQRADEIHHSEDADNIDWFLPIIADAESGFGGSLNAFELMKAMIEAGAAAVHFEDQLSSAKKCGHMGGKVLVPTQEAVQKLNAARLAADVYDVPSLIIARTDANSAALITSDIDDYDKHFIEGSQRSAEGFYRVRASLDQGIARGLAYAPYADLLWLETSKPDIGEAKAFAQAIHEKYPGKYLAYNCSPSFNWKKNLDASKIADFQNILGEMGYKFQFVTLAGFHALNYSMFNLATSYKKEQMKAYSLLQEREFESEAQGYTATKHQREVGAGYFDKVMLSISQQGSSLAAIEGSTEQDQF